MEICYNCTYHCIHHNTGYKKNKPVCWNCFTANHLLAIVFKIDNMDFFICNEEIREKMIDYPGYFFCYNYTNKIYKLIKIQDLIKDNYFLIKHIVSQYVYLSKSKLLFKKVNKITTENYDVLDEIFKEKYMLNLNPLEIVKSLI